jgi:hypothetical protein
VPVNQHCCCIPCQTKEESGLPDELTVAFNILTSGSTGMPGTTPFDTCGAEDINMTFTSGTDIIGLLTSLTFDYQEVAEFCGGGCCFRYDGQTPDTGPCGTEGKLLGPTPFSNYASDGDSGTLTWVGDDQLDPQVDDDPDACCNFEHDQDCGGICGNLVYNDGSTESPLDIYASSAFLCICIEGEVVTLNLSVTIVQECKVYTGFYGRSGPQVDQNHPDDWPPPCDYGQFHDIPGADYTEACGSFSTSIVAFEATADLSAVSGETIWEKIQNAPAEAWVSSYESSMCNCGAGGCVDSVTTETRGCGIDAYTCICDTWDGTVTVDVDEGVAVDLPCIYSVGTMELSLS